MMKRLIMPVVCAVVCLLGLGCQTAAYEQEAVQTSDKQHNDSDTWDFKTVSEGKNYSHAFIFKNGTGKIVHIKDVSTSCGCTVSTVKKHTIAPGESTEIAVTFDSTGYEGSVIQFVYVRTDSLDKPIVRFIIKAFVGR